MWRQQLDNTKTKRNPQHGFIIMEMISQVHMTDQVMLPLPKHSFVALGLPRKAQCPCSGKKFYVFTEGPRTQPQPGMRNSHKWVRVLPTKIIARLQERQLHGVQMTCQLHNAVSRHCHPSISQLCDKASRHCGTKPNNNRTNVTIPRYVETFVQQCRDRL